MVVRHPHRSSLLQHPLPSSPRAVMVAVTAMATATLANPVKDVQKAVAHAEKVVVKDAAVVDAAAVAVIARVAPSVNALMPKANH